MSKQTPQTLGLVDLREREVEKREEKKTKSEQERLCTKKIRTDKTARKCGK